MGTRCVLALILVGACQASPVAMDSAFGGSTSFEETADAASTSYPTSEGDGSASTSTTSDGSAHGSSGGTVCGNGILEGDELCDDGNTDDTDACTAACVPAACGDGALQAAQEECDEGPDNGPGTRCSTECKLNVCGDGDHGPDEACDDGNTDDMDACTSLCELAACGDGIVHVGVESCDAQGDSAICDGDCTPAACGDGYTNHVAGEECDDGNTSSLDNCYPSCKAPTMLVFVTSVLYSGDLGGLVGADAKCQSLAKKAEVTGIFKAWLETANEPAATRLYHSPGRYKRLDGVVVADNFEHLRDGPLHAPLTITETKQDVHDLTLMDVYEKGIYKIRGAYWSWEGDVGFQHSYDYCKDWMSSSSSYMGVVSMVDQPDFGASPGDVTYNCNPFRLSLVCVQQAWYPEDPMPR